MKKIAVVVLAFALLMMFSAIAPVMAASSKRIPVTFVRASPFLIKGEFWVTEGDTFHSRGWGAGFNSYCVMGTGLSLVGGTSGTYVANVNLKTGVVGEREGSQIWHSHLTFADGTFDGIIIAKGSFAIVSSGSFIGYMSGVDTVVSAIWHGTGAYRGWTLTLDYETQAGVVPSPLMGYLLIP